MKKYVMLIDVEKCSQCYNCVLACKDEHFENEYLPISIGMQEFGQNWLELKVDEHGEKDVIIVDCWPEGCRHCEAPDCVKESDAVYRRDDGIVIIDPIKAKQQEALLSTCPYSSISWNSERNLPQKCTMCAHLLDKGEKEPRCVEACPNSTLRFGDLNDPESEVARIVRENPELVEQRSIVRYYNRPGRVIAGSVYKSQLEVAEGAEVQLVEGDRLVAQTRTNGFGDFRFSKLPVNKQYKINISLGGFSHILIEVDTVKDVVFEEIMFVRA